LLLSGHERSPLTTVGAVVAISAIARARPFHAMAQVLTIGVCLTPEGCKKSHNVNDLIRKTCNYFVTSEVTSKSYTNDN